VGGDRATLLTPGTNVTAAADGANLWVTATDTAGRGVVREIGVDGRVLSAASVAGATATAGGPAFAWSRDSA